MLYSMIATSSAGCQCTSTHRILVHTDVSPHREREEAKVKLDLERDVIGDSPLLPTLP